MLKRFSKMKQALTVVLAAVFFCSGVFYPARAAANDLLNILFGAAVEYAMFASYIDNIDEDPGRQEFFAETKYELGVNSDPALNAELDDIMNRLNNAVYKYDPQVKSKPFLYFINNSKDFNAFCTFGHILSINTGCFTTFNNNEDEIAVIMAHEMVHGVKDHVRNSVMDQIPLQVLAAAYVSENSNILSYVLTGVVYNYIVARGYTLPQEWEADNNSFLYYTTAGFNPGAGAAVWQRVIDKFGEGGSFFLTDALAPNDHPDNNQRRDNYSLKMSEYCNNLVMVKDAKIMIAGNELYTTKSAADMSAAERSYIVAGRIARLMHENAGKKVDYKVEARDGAVYVNDYAIIYPVSGESSAEDIANRLSDYLQLAQSKVNKTASGL